MHIHTITTYYSTVKLHGDEKRTTAISVMATRMIVKQEVQKVQEASRTPSQPNILL